jgi:hypothetical protein
VRSTACIAAGLAALAAAGCGDAAGPAEGPPTARFTFTSGGALQPPLVRARGPQVRLVLVAEDGRPHGVVVRTPSRRVRLLVEPGAEASATLTGLTSGSRLRVVPDGATEPVTLQVE